ncbi:MAG: MFS transporter [Hyphomicrobiales bacterium]|nr:MFS transporter [Hyphomicrobiales bacterium]
MTANAQNFETSLSSEIAARVETLEGGAYLWRLVVLISLGGWFEIYDLFFTGYIAPGLAKSGLLTTTTQAFFGFSGIGAFVAATFAGLFVGTFFLGFLPDRFGRRSIFTWSLIVYALATLVMACQTTSAGVLIWRFVAGIGLGVEIVTIDAYITELVPTRIRGRAFAVNQAVMLSAVPVVALLSWWLAPQAPLGAEGWRWVVAIGSIASMAIWIIRREIPESPLWLAQMGRSAEAERIMAQIEGRSGVSADRRPEDIVAAISPSRAFGQGYATLLKPGYLGLVLLLVVFNLCQAFGVYGFANWVPTLLVEKGITITKSLEYSFIIAIAYPVAPLLTSIYADRVERKWIICGAALAIAVFGILFSQVTAPWMLIICGVMITVANMTMSYAYHAYQTEVFPTAIRARAAGIVYSASRVAAMFSGFIVAFMLKSTGVVGVFGLITLAMAIVILSIGAFGPNVRNRQLDAPLH